MRTLLAHSTPYLILTALAAVSACYASDAVQTATAAARMNGTLTEALQQARSMVNVLWLTAGLVPLLGLWSHNRSQALAGYTLAAVGCLVAFLTLDVGNALGFETERLLGLMRLRF